LLKTAKHFNISTLRTLVVLALSIYSR